VEQKETDLAREVRGLLAQGRFPEAEAALDAADREEPEEGRELPIALLRGELREAEGRPAEAAVHYLAVAGAEAGTPAAVVAWDRLARLRREAGDRLGAARAELRAWESSGAEGRASRAARARREVGMLSRGELGVLGYDVHGMEAYSFIREELRVRRERGGDDADLFVTVLAPFSGDLAPYGEAFWAGAEIAWRERSEGEAVADSLAPPIRVRLVRRDTRGDLLRAGESARQAVLEDGSVAILGPLLSVTGIAAGAVAQSYGVPMICPTTTDPELAGIGSYIVPLDHAPADLARPLAAFAVDSLGVRRFGVLLPNEPVAQEYEREFRDEVTARGGEVVVSLAFEPGEHDFRRLLERLDRERVGAVYVPGYAADLEALATQLDFYEFRHRILGHDAWTDPQVLDPGNPALEGAVFAVTTTGDPDSPFVTGLRAQVRRATRQELTRFHVDGYRAMSALLGAVEQAGRDGECLAELLHRRSAWEHPPEAEGVELLTYRDGVLGPASWAPGFDLVPKIPRAARDDEVEDETSDDGTGG